MLKYFKYELACNIAFGVFLVTWLITRHIFYPLLCWNIYKDLPPRLPYGCYSGSTAEMLSTDGYPNAFAYMFAPFLDLNNPICMNGTTKWIFLSFLLFLQGLSLIWFTMVVRVAVGVLRTGNAEDTRSDDEEAGENGRLSAKDGANGAVISENPNSLDRRRSNGAASVRARGRGRVRLDQSDRKALLGRIGCDKPTN